MNSPADANPRYASLLILNEYLQKKTNLKNLINKYLEEHMMSDLDRRFLFQIVKGTVRYLLKIDFLIEIFSDIKIKKIDLGILNLLREAAYQILYMDRIPVHSVVDESVKISKKISGIYASGFVNAVLRKMSRISDLNAFVEDRITESFGKTSERISLTHSFPLWLFNYWMDMYGKEKAEAICKSLNNDPIVTLMVNTAKIIKGNLLKILAEYFNRSGKNILLREGSATEAELFENCIFLQNSQGLYDLRAFKEGYFSIQDFSSQMSIKYFLKPQKGEKILDLCGAPGGKAALMSVITSGICEVISVDINNYRLDLFKENIRRLGLGNIFIVKADAARSGYLSGIGNADNFINYFDKVFIDAPCSSFGTISKNPDAKYNRDYSDLKKLSEKSAELISNCIPYLKPGGVIVFYTCTLSKVENQDMIKKVISSGTSLKIIKISVPSVIKRYLYEKKIEPGSYKGFFEVMPYFFNSEAGFIAVMEKKI